MALEIAKYLILRGAYQRLPRELRNPLLPNEMICEQVVVSRIVLIGEDMSIRSIMYLLPSTDCMSIHPQESTCVNSIPILCYIGIKFISVVEL